MLKAQKMQFHSLQVDHSWDGSIFLPLREALLHFKGVFVPLREVYVHLGDSVYTGRYLCIRKRQQCLRKRPGGALILVWEACEPLIQCSEYTILCLLCTLCILWIFCNLASTDPKVLLCFSYSCRSAHVFGYVCRCCVTFLLTAQFWGMSVHVGSHFSDGRV